MHQATCGPSDGDPCFRSVNQYFIQGVLIFLFFHYLPVERKDHIYLDGREFQSVFLEVMCLLIGAEV